MAAALLHFQLSVCLLLLFTPGAVLCAHHRLARLLQSTGRSEQSFWPLPRRPTQHPSRHRRARERAGAPQQSVVEVRRVFAKAARSGGATPRARDAHTRECEQSTCARRRRRSCARLRPSTTDRAHVRDRPHIRPSAPTRDCPHARSRLFEHLPATVRNVMRARSRPTACTPFRGRSRTRPRPSATLPVSIRNRPRGEDVLRGAALL
jgi:hypothetical protein